MKFDSELRGDSSEKLYLESRDAALRNVYKVLSRRVFIVSRILRRISFSVYTVSEGFTLGRGLFSRIEIHGLSQKQVSTIMSYILSEDWCVSMNEVKRPDGSWSVELS